MTATTLTNTPTTFAGTKDWFGTVERERRLVIDTIRRVYESFGFEPLTTPAMEYQSVLYREEGQTAQKTFHVRINRLDLTRGSEHKPLALRFDHTVPLSRFAAEYATRIAFPLKRYAIGPVWRADKPQRERFREFTQVDFDTVGAYSMYADAEVAAVLCSAVDAVGISRYSLQINHRQLLNAMAKYVGAKNDGQVTEILRYWDNLGKVNLKSTAKKMSEEGFDREVVDRFVRITTFLKSIKGSNDNRLNLMRAEFSEDTGIQLGLDTVVEMLELISLYSYTSRRVVFTPSLARGFSYYTGPVFEMFAPRGRSAFAAGGRFDDLVKKQGGPDLPATGASFGLERFVEVVRQHGTLFSELTSNDVYVTLFNQLGESQLCTNASVLAAESARKAGFRVEIYSGKETIGKQLAVANRKGYKVAIIIGPDELAESSVTVKDMTASFDPQGNQRRVPIADLVSELQSMLR